MPYLKAGLESNEFCNWVVSTLSMNRKPWKRASTIPNFGYYLANGQIEIVPYTNWYLRNGKLYLTNLINDWIERMENAISRGFDGLRATGNTAWLDEKDWGSFLEYDTAISKATEGMPVIILCTYSIPLCSASHVIDG